MNRTGVLLPQINASNMMAPSYKFQAGSNERKAEDDKKPADSGKFKIGSTAGAGFSSTASGSGAGGSSSYEPSIGGRRTPRRILGNIKPN